MPQHKKVYRNHDGIPEPRRSGLFGFGDIYEAGKDIAKMNAPNKKGKAAIYHFTNAVKNPRVCQQELERLTEFVKSFGFDDIEIFLDRSRRGYERAEFNRLTTVAEQFDVLVTRDFAHICRNTKRCIEIMMGFRNRGVRVYSIENGPFSLDEAPFEKPLKVATYNDCFFDSDRKKGIIHVQNEILKMFIAKKTNWILIEQYFDQDYRTHKTEQTALKKLLVEKDKYDIIVVNSLGDISWRIEKFCKSREILQMDIYSLQEGFLTFEKGQLPTTKVAGLR